MSVLHATQFSKMAGVGNFVGKLTGTPPEGIPPNRAAAAFLKVAPNSMRGVNPAPSIQSLPGVTHNPGFVSDAPNTFPSPPYGSHQPSELGHERPLFEDSARSNFDDTMSIMQGGGQISEGDVNFDQQNGYSNENFQLRPLEHGRMGHPYHEDNTAGNTVKELAYPKPHYEQSQSQRESNQIGAPTGPYPIAGRFLKPSFPPNEQHHLDSNGHALSQDGGAPNKRGYPDERHEAIRQVSPGQFRDVDRGRWAQDSNPEESDSNAPARQQLYGGSQSEGRDEYWPAHRAQILPGQHEETYIPNIDYDDERLKSMSFAELKQESWDMNLLGEPLDLLPENLRSGATISEKLDFFIKEDADVYGSLFEHMPTAEWELAGDLILERMTNLMQKIQAARAKKRKVVEGFEAVYEARGDAVKNKTQKYENKLKDMKSSGEVVLRGKKT